MNSLVTYNARQVVQEMLEKSAFSKYLVDGKVNHYMIDNEIFENAVRGYYHSDADLIDAYKQTRKFRCKVIQEEYFISDNEEAEIRNAKKQLRPVMELILPKLKKLHNADTKDLGYALSLELLKSQHRSVYREFEVIGFEKAATLNFDYRRVTEAIAEGKKKKEQFPIITELNNTFKIGKVYSSAEIKKKMQNVYKKLRRSGLSASVQELKKYFVIQQKRTSKGVKYLVLKAIHNA